MSPDEFHRLIELGQQIVDLLFGLGLATCFGLGVIAGGQR